MKPTASSTAIEYQQRQPFLIFVLLWIALLPVALICMLVFAVMGSGNLPWWLAAAAWGCAALLFYLMLIRAPLGLKEAYAGRKVRIRVDRSAGTVTITAGKTLEVYAPGDFQKIVIQPIRLVGRTSYIACLVGSRGSCPLGFSSLTEAAMTRKVKSLKELSQLPVEMRIDAVTIGDLARLWKETQQS
jgi:hypothetical protein